MNDVVSSARSAREKLAQGLAALQLPGVPPGLADVAEPIAMAMGALHRIESSQGGALAANAPGGLDAVRRALAMLQAQAGAHPAVEQAMEAVAGSLGMVHQLTQRAAAPAPAAPPAAQVYAPAPVTGAAAFAQTAVLDHGPATQPSPAVAAPWQAQQPAHPPPQQWQQPAPQAAPPQPAPHWQQPAAPPQWQQPAAQAAAPQPAPQQWQQPAPQPAPQQWQQPAPQPAAPHWQQPAAPAAPQWQAPGAPPAAVPAGNQLRAEAELGAHSPTNFYKGLSGNDVIESGGIFIATYQIPEIGQQLMIKVSMPGGYEFEAQGIVRWTRDMPHSGADSPPGYGAQFTQITPEGRQLVYRYVRNREPLFHDDL